MVWKPRVVVASIIKRDDRFLMVEEIINGEAVINQPAGHLEYGESVIDAARRETLEETGWHFEPTALLGILHLHADDPDRVFLRFAFTGDLLKHDPDYELDSDIHAVHWLTAEELAQNYKARSHLVADSIALYESGVRHPLSLLEHRNVISWDNDE